MVDIDLIRLIMETYDFTPKTREKIVSVAISQIERKGLDSVERIYTYVCNLAEWFQSKFKHSPLSLEDKLSGDLGLTIGETLGIEDANQQAVLRTGSFSLDNALVLLRDHLTEAEQRLLDHLSGDETNLFRMNPEEFSLQKELLTESIQQIRQRLEIIAARYERDGKIVIPRRPIVSVQFEPEFSVRYGLRRYNGNPIAIYREDTAVQGLSRSGLKRADQSLYVKLRQTGQIAEAIPEVLSHLPDSEVKRIIEAHGKYKGNASKASKNLVHVISTVVKYWEEAGLQAQGKREIDLESETAKIILAANTDYRGNVSHATKNLHKAPATVSKYWKATGLPIIGRQSSWNVLQQSEIERILAAHETYNGNSREAARHLPYAQTTIGRYWRAVGLKVTGNIGRVSGAAKLAELKPHQVQQLLEAHKTYGGKATKVAKGLHHNIETVLKYWRDAGLRIRGQGDSNLSDEEVKVIVAGYKTYNGNAKEATKYLPYSSSTIRKYWRGNGLRVA